MTLPITTAYQLGHELQQEHPKRTAAQIAAALDAALDSPAVRDAILDAACAALIAPIPITGPTPRPPANNAAIALTDIILAARNLDRASTAGALHTAIPINLWHHFLGTLTHAETLVFPRPGAAGAPHYSSHQ